MVEKLIDKFVKSGLPPNGFYVMYCIYNRLETKMVNKDLETQRLINDGWLEDDDTLSEKGILFLKNIDNIDIKRPTLVTKEAIQKYNDLFPKIKLPTNKYARVNTKSLETVFKWFFKEYDYTWDEIYRATERYVTDWAQQGYKYMRTSLYFIRKQATDRSFESELATYCEMLYSDEEDIHLFRENVV